MASTDAVADPTPPPFTVETILSECRRDVVALAEWAGGPMPAGALDTDDAAGTPSTSRATHAPRAYIGLDDGTLLVLRREGGGGGEREADAGGAAPQPPQAAASLLIDAAPPWRVVAAHAHVAQKAVRQMQIAPGPALLLVLNEEGVTAFRLPACTTACQAPRTRGAAAFAWTGAPGNGAGGGTLAVALKRRVALFTYDGSEFVAGREVALPGSPTALAWAGGRLVAGGKKGWWAVAGAAAGAGGGDALTPTDLAPGPPPPAPALAVTLWEGGVEDGERSLTTGPPPEGVALTTERGAALAGADGGRAGRAGRRLDWKGVGAPAALAASPPYVAALLPGGVEVRADLAPGFHGGGGDGRSGGGGGSGGGGATGAATLIPGLACMAVAAGATPSGPGCAVGAAAPRPGAAILVAGGGRVARLVPRPFGEQAVALLRLFPALAPADELEAVAAGLGLPPRPPSPAACGAAAPPGDGGAKAAAAVLPYLVSLRGRLGEGGAASASAPPASSGAAPPPSLPPAACLASMVDTAIVRAHLACGPAGDDGSLLRFLARGGGGGGAGSACAHDAPRLLSGGPAEQALRDAGRYAELVALLQAAGRHEAALDVLKALATDRASLPVPPAGAAADLAGVTAAWAAVRALHAAKAGSRPDLIHAHARWVLASDPDAGLGALLELDPPPPPAVALAAIRAGAPSLALPYLESALDRGIVQHADWDGELAGMLVRHCLGGGSGGGGDGGGGGAGGAPSPTAARPAPGTEAEFARLLTLASTSPHVDPARLLAGLPPGALLALRAALLERAGDASGALRLCVFEASDDAAAEALAARAAEKADDPMRPFLELAGLLVEREGGSAVGDGGPGWRAAARALARAVPRAGGGGAPAALAALPDGVPLATALPAVEAALASGAGAARAAALERALRKADGLAARAAAAKARAGALVVTADRACCLCTRRLGAAAFAALGGGDRLAHLSCHLRAAEGVGGREGGG